MHQKRTILVVDDEKLTLGLLAAMFDDTEFEIVRARNGNEALQKLRALEKCDVILLDRMMPQQNGMEVLRALKASPRFHDIPVIMETAAGLPSQMNEAMKAGACAYIVKPFDEEMILTAVRDAIASNPVPTVTCNR